MCGICGFVNLTGAPASREIAIRMNRALYHRGPDDEGILVDGNAALAMRRLAIIDVPGGHQPLSNEDRTIWTVFNGEIYNAPALRAKLKEAGHRFATNSDTEIIVHQYEESGVESARLLRGMFAYALLDKRVGNAASIAGLTLVRDRLGIKPLYYYQDNKLVAFSSELTSLVQHPGVPRAIEPAALRQFLATGAAAAPLTMFRGIRQLMPGQYMTVAGGRVNTGIYWELPASPGANTHSVDEAVADIRHLLEASVKEHLLSDVPVGAFLSGGIDSSTVVAIMAHNATEAIPTFSIRFEESGYDESSYARLIADIYETDHHEYTVPNKGFDEDLVRTMITHHGQPTADSSALPTFLVSHLARKHVKVALSGDGGDECFAGYGHYGWLPKIEHLYMFPRALRKRAKALLSMIGGAPWIGRQSGLRQLYNALEVSSYPKYEMPYEVLRINNEEELDKLLLPEWRQGGSDSKAPLQQFLKEAWDSDLIALAQRFSFRYYLPDVYLPKVDRMSMAAGLEVRVPFLDHRLVEYALTLPGNMHWREGGGKWLLRKAVSDLLPQDIFQHRKQGFSIPLHRWITAHYYELVEELLSVEAVTRRGLFNPASVRTLIDRCRGRDGGQNVIESDYRRSHRLFMLVVLELWCRMFIDDLIESPSGVDNLTAMRDA